MGVNGMVGNVVVFGEGDLWLLCCYFWGGVVVIIVVCAGDS